MRACQVGILGSFQTVTYSSNVNLNSYICTENYFSQKYSFRMLIVAKPVYDLKRSETFFSDFI